MKRMILIAVLFCLASAPMAMAQRGTYSTRQQFVKPESASEALVRRAEANYKKAYNHKGNTLKPTDFNKLDRQNAKELAAMKEQERISAATRQLSAWRMRQELDARRDQVNNALKALDNLLVEQHKERARLEERQSIEAAGGITAEMKKRHETELSNLDEKHARQIMAAQLKINEASKAFEMLEDTYMGLNR